MATPPSEAINSATSCELSDDGLESATGSSGESSRRVTSDEADVGADEEMPPNFSWVIVDLLCACAFPASLANLRYLKNQGVTCIVSLTAERHLPKHDLYDLKVVRIEVEDLTPPALSQVHKFIHIVDAARTDKTAVAVHCAAGKGRTGTVIACYLMHYLHLGADEAIRKIRALRPGSVETSEQVELVHIFERSTRRPAPAGPGGS